MKINHKEIKEGFESSKSFYENTVNYRINQMLKATTESELDENFRVAIHSLITLWASCKSFIQWNEEAKTKMAAMYGKATQVTEEGGDNA